MQAKLLDPVYAFDRQVIPAGATVFGRVARVKPMPKAQRVRSILGGDFTPLHTAGVEFTGVLLPDGKLLPIRTNETPGFYSIVSSRKPDKQPAPADPSQNTGVVATGKQKARDAIQGQIDRARSIRDTVRGPGKLESVENYLMSRLPYHPQYVFKGTRFDAELTQALSFGNEPVTTASLASIGTQPPAASVAHARLLAALDSASARAGDPVEAVLAEPLYSADHHLILPEGTRVEGAVAVSRRARWFHRTGRLRFNFRQIALPEEVVRLQDEATPVSAAAPKPAQQELKLRTEANLQTAESSGNAAIQVDHEGGVQAKESKTRFLAAAAAVLVARSAGDNDPVRNSNHQVIGQRANVGGRTLGGGLGFGLLGMGISQSSRWVGAAFGYYGMAWSLFSTLIARGSEVHFGKDAMIDIRFDTRAGDAAAGPPAR